MNFEFQLSLPQSLTASVHDAEFASHPSKKDGSLRQRNWHPKSRYGCVTCKRRRVKCDETKPVCLRCKSLEKDCRYEVVKVKLFEPSRTDLSIPRSIVRLLETDEESRALQIYQDVLTAVLGNFNSAAEYFWRCLVPQTSEQNEAIKHQLVATAFMEDPFLNESLSKDEAERRAGRYYGKALALLTRGDTPLERHIMLISCLLSMAYETIRGDDASIFLHFQSGLQVLREWKHENLGKHKHLSGVDEAIYLYIEPIFAQLEAAAAMRGITGRIPITPIEELACTRPIMHDHFSTIIKAREKFAELGSWIYYQYRLHPLSYLAGHPIYKDLLVIWKEWYQTFLRSKDKWPIKTPRQRLQLNLLDAFYRNHLVTFLSQAEPQEVAWDKYIDEYRRQIEVCEEVIKSDETYKAITDPLTFDFDTDPGPLPPLWQMAVNCRDPGLRHRCLDLLQIHHRRCGHEDDCSARAIAEAVINIEEANHPNAQSCHDIPENARVRVLEADLSEPGKLTLKLFRYPYVTVEFVEVPVFLMETPPVVPFKLFPLAESMRLAGYQGLIRPKARSCRCKSYGGK